MDRDKIKRISSVVLLVISVVAFGISGFLYLREEHRVDDLKKSCTAETEGIIISIDKHTEAHSEHVTAHTTKQVKETYYLTKYDYTVDGQQYTLSEDIRTTYPPSVGAMTTVRYDPSDPEKAYTGSVPMSESNKYLRFMIPSGVLGAVMLISVISMLKRR